MFCITCGKENADDAEYCLGCGRKLDMLRENTVIDSGAESYIPPSQRPKSHGKTAAPAEEVSEPKPEPQPEPQPTPASQAPQPVAQPAPAPQPAPVPASQVPAPQPVYTVAQPVYTVVQPVYTAPPVYRPPVQTYPPRPQYAPPPAYPQPGFYPSRPQLTGEARQTFEGRMRHAWRKVAGSPAMILLCVVMTLQFLFQLIPLLTGKATGYGSSADVMVAGTTAMKLGALVGMIPNLILVIGAWIICGDGFREKTAPIKTVGITMIRGVIITMLVFVWIAVGAVALVALVQLADPDPYSYYYGEQMVIMLFVVAAVFTLLILFLCLVLRSLKNARHALNHCIPNPDRATAMFVVAIILGALELISVFAMPLAGFTLNNALSLCFIALCATVAGLYRSFTLRMQREYNQALAAQNVPPAR